MPNGESAKKLGAFYTDVQIANFLVGWAIRSAQDTVMDPSFGGGVFLRSACQRLAKLGGQPVAQVFGVEIDLMVYAQTAKQLAAEWDVNQQNLVLSNFFGLDQMAVPPVDAVVGNPPFIRYQRFSGEARKLALMRAAKEGVHLTELSSSWAPFVIYSIALLKQGGRLALVVPMEIGHAAYARPVLDYLSKSFRKVTFLTFRRSLFPDLNEDTLLLLAEDKGTYTAEFVWCDLPHAGVLTELQDQGRGVFAQMDRLDAQALSQGRERLIEYFIPPQARDLYRQLKCCSFAQRLGDIADVGIGYVTGANDFFHLSPGEAHQWDIPERFLKPAVRRGRALSGLWFTPQDLQTALKSGEASYLLSIEQETALPESICKYLAYGEARRVPDAYKCRSRSPWFRVPHVYQPDALLSYMSGVMPHLVANDARVVAPNSLHILRLHPHTHIPSSALPVLWQTSLTRLSVEIEGHALGGGMLKLEPTEAENVMVPSPQVSLQMLVALGEELDGLIRNGDHATAQTRADTIILHEGLGLSQRDCHLLRMAARILQRRRCSRSAAA